MRLLSCDTLQLELFQNRKSTPPYAILSHTWGDEEVTFGDIHESAKERDFRLLREKLEGHTASVASESVTNSNTLGSSSITGIDYSDFPHLQYAIKMKGWSKIEGCIREAKNHGIDYIWCDTCCIDKSSSSELSEAINSMWTWYRDAKVCFAYLGDVDHPKVSANQSSNSDSEPSAETLMFFREWYTPNSPTKNMMPHFRIFRPINPSKDRIPNVSRYFERGWTLQELIAPTEVLFFRRDWSFIGARSELSELLSQLTLIPKNLLTRERKLDLSVYSVAERMHWASRRSVTREEDHAYSLLGLMGVTLPAIYGEGSKNAMYRLQIAIYQATGDHSMFTWKESKIPFINDTLELELKEREQHQKWDKITDGQVVTHFTPNLVSLFSCSLHDYATCYGIVSRAFDIKNATHELGSETPSIVVETIDERGSFAHTTPILLPMLRKRRFVLPNLGNASEYLGILSCGPAAEPDKFYALRLVI